MRKHLSAFAVVLSAAAAQAPLVVQRTPPPDPQQLQAALDALGNSATPAATVTTETAPPLPPPASGGTRRAPRHWKPPVAQLDAATRAALAMAERAQKQGAPAIADETGQIQYLYGSGLPTIVCAPLHFCTLVLEDDETVVAPPLASDKRWQIGKLTDHLLWLRPYAASGALPTDANLILVTNLRTYYLRLVCTERDYMARVSFLTPPKLDSATEWTPETHAAAEAIATVPRSGGYRWYGQHRLFRGEQHPAWWPLTVEDDGTFVYITLPPSVTHLRAPKLVLVGPNGMSPANYDIRGNTYVVRGLFLRAALVDGVGRKRQQVTIVSPREGR